MRYVVIAARLDEKQKFGWIAIHDGSQDRSIIVTRRALLSIASPPRATEGRLLQNLDAFCEIALAQNFDAGSGDKITITAKHVRTWRGPQIDEPAWSWGYMRTPGKTSQAEALPCN